MSNILDDFTADETVPEGIKEKIMQTARVYLLAKDLGELYTLGIGEATKDIATGHEDSIINPNK